MAQTASKNSAPNKASTMQKAKTMMSQRNSGKPPKAEDKKPGIGKRIKNWLHEYKVEMKKIRWMKPGAVFKNMGIVLASIILVGAFVFGLDTGLINLFRLFMHVG